MLKHTFRVAAILLSAASSPVLAQSASSSGYAVVVNETVDVPLVADVNVSIGPVAPAGGSSPPPYDTTNTVLSLDQNSVLIAGPFGIGQHLEADVLTTNATGTASGAESTSTVNNFLLSVAGLSNLLSISATTIEAYSQANSLSGLNASGTTTIEGLNLGGTLLGSLLLDGSLYVNPAPNTILLSLGGLSIILNEQNQIGDGITSLGIETNAIHIDFNNFVLGTGLVNGDIIVGHSQAWASVGERTAGAVPEPATWAMMLLGFGMVGFAIRRGRAASLPAAA